MEGSLWKKWEGKKVFIILKNKRTYSGVITEVDDFSKPLIWFTLHDKFDLDITFVNSEIELIQEEA